MQRQAQRKADVAGKSLFSCWDVIKATLKNVEKKDLKSLQKLPNYDERQSIQIDGSYKKKRQSLKFLKSH